MNSRKLVVEGFEDNDYESIKVKGGNVEVEIPVLEARVLLRAFVEDLEEELEAGTDNHGRKSNDLAQIIESSNMLNENELTEILAENKKHHGKSKAYRDVAIGLYDRANSFIESHEET